MACMYALLAFLGVAIAGAVGADWRIGAGLGVLIMFLATSR